MLPNSITVLIIKDGATVASEEIERPEQGDVEAVITRLISSLRKERKSPLWPFQIDVR